MEDSINERIKRIIEIEKFRNPSHFAATIGVHRQSVSGWLEGKKVSGESIEMILQNFPKISEQWLRYGKGEMYRSPSLNKVQEPKEEYLPANTEDLLRDLKNDIERLKKEIQKKERYIQIIENSANKKQ